MKVVIEYEIRGSEWWATDKTADEIKDTLAEDYDPLSDILYSNGFVVRVVE